MLPSLAENPAALDIETAVAVEKSIAAVRIHTLSARFSSRVPG